MYDAAKYGRKLGSADKRREAARRMRAQGMDVGEIAKKMDVHRSTILTYFREDKDRENAKKGELLVATLARESVTPTEIEAFKKTCKPGTFVKAMMPVRKEKDSDTTKNVEVYTEIIGMYTHIAHTRKGCFRWADLVLANRRGA